MKILEVKMVTKVSETKNLVELGIKQPKEAFSKIEQLAQSDDWKVREVVATCLIEIGRKRPQEVIAEMVLWAYHKDANIRRAAVEGLRDIAKKEPKAVFCPSWERPRPMTIFMSRKQSPTS